MKFPYRGFNICVEVRDDHSVVSRLSRGSSYGHLVRNSEYHRLENRDVEITSSLDDMQQLNFRSGAAWKCTLHLFSYDPESNTRELLHCLPALIRAQDKISVSVVNDPPFPQDGTKIDDLTIL